MWFRQHQTDLCRDDLFAKNGKKSGNFYISVYRTDATNTYIFQGEIRPFNKRIGTERFVIRSNTFDVCMDAIVKKVREEGWLFSDEIDAYREEMFNKETNK